MPRSLSTRVQAATSWRKALSSKSAPAARFWVAALVIPGSFGFLTPLVIYEYATRTISRLPGWNAPATPTDRLSMDTQVLVVGGGPTGLTLAIALGQRGVKCTLV